jgi:hypothetical protein
MTIKNTAEPSIKESATSKTTKLMSSSFLQPAAYWTGVAAVAFTAVAAVAGSLAWYFSNKLSDIKKTEFDTFRESSQKSISEAQARSAEENARAAKHSFFAKSLASPCEILAGFSVLSFCC